MINDLFLFWYGIMGFELEDKKITEELIFIQKLSFKYYPNDS